MRKQIENYSLSEQIGEGAYGKVYKAKHIITNQYFAVKVISLQKFRQNQKLKECFANQKKTLTSIRPCKHIIKYITQFKTQNNFYFVYQYCNGGTLESLLKKQGHLSQKKALSIFAQLIEAFKVLNQFGIIHRDTKPQNILFNNGIIKLGDFGFCKFMDGNTDMTATMLGSPIYMAPEVLKGQQYTNKIDIWSLGAVLYEMLFGMCPFQSRSIVQLISTIRDTNIVFPLQINRVSSGTQTLIRRMLVKEAQFRIRWDQLFLFKFETQEQDRKRQILLDLDKITVKQIRKEKEVQRQREKHKQIDKQRQASIQKTAMRSNYNIGSNYDSYAATIHKPSINRISFQTLPLSSPQYSKYAQTFKNSKSHGLTGSALIFNPVARRKSVIQEHQLCTRGIKTSIDIININDRNSMSYSYLILDHVKNRLKKIKQGISVSDVDLGDIYDVITEQLQNVQKNVLQLRQELEDQNFDLKMLNNAKIYLSVKFREFDCDIKVWFQMINVLFGDKNNMNPRDKTRQEMVSFIRQKLR